MRTLRNLTTKLSGYATLSTVLLVLGGMLLASCDDFLSENPRGSLSQPVLATKSGAEALLVGAYAGLDDITFGWQAAPDHWVYGSIMGGEAKKGTDAGDQNLINPLMRGLADPTNDYLNSQWRAKYEGIARTNEVLKLLALMPEGQLSPEERTNIEAQARFLRAHHYFELRRQFANVPWVDETTEQYDVPNDMDIWPNIEADFQFAYENLPETQPEVMRVNKWAAGAYLGKTYLYQEKWQQARDLLTTVINEGNTTDGKPYGLVAKYHDLFFPATEHNEEVVFAIEFTGRDGLTGGIQNSRDGSMLNYPYNSPFRCCGFFQPSQNLVNAFQTVNGLPPVGTHNATMVKSDNGISSNVDFTPHEGTLDPRLDWTVGRRGLPYLDWGPHPGQRWIRDQAYAGPYAPKKHVYHRATEEADANPQSWAPGTAVNHHVIRFADVLLMAAEAEAELGNTAQALEYVNMVRARAQNPEGFVKNSDNELFAVAVVDNQADMLASGAVLNDWVVRTDRNSTFVLIRGGEGAATDINNWVEYPAPNYEVGLYSAADFASPEQALEKIRHERMLELAMEGHRLYDLFRWGIAPEVMNAYYAYEGQHSIDVEGASWQLPGPYFPIPQRQLDLSLDLLKQNPGY